MDESTDYELFSFFTVLRSGHPSHVLQGLRAATPDEIHTTSRPERDLLAWISYNSMIGEISHTIHEFDAAVEALGALLRSPDDATLGFPRVQHRFGSVLLAARAFADRNDRWMKHRFGARSQERVAFKAACSHEFDNVTAYRLGYGMRNIVAHAGDAINIGRVRSTSDPDGTRYHLTLGIDGPRLAAEYSSHLSARVRDDLLALNEPLSVFNFVEMLGTAITRIHSKALDMMADHVRELGNILEAAQSEAESAAGTDAIRSNGRMHVAAALVPAGIVGKDDALASGNLRYIQLPVHLFRTATLYLSDNVEIRDECDAILADDNAVFGAEPKIFGPTDDPGSAHPGDVHAAPSS